jgi:hypothetical protein
MSKEIVGSIHPSPEQFRAFSELDQATPITMLNLLRFSEQAEPGSVAAGMSGRDAYAEYAKRVGELPTDIFRGQLQTMLSGLMTLIGPADEEWDEILLVRYDTVSDFLLMATNHDYLVVSEWRTAALADSRLVAFASS